MRNPCLENVALVQLRGQSKTVFGNTRPKRPRRPAGQSKRVLEKSCPKRPDSPKRPDLLRAQPMFEKRGTIDPRYSDQAQAIAVNKQLTLPV